MNLPHDVPEVLDTLLPGIQEALGDNLVGVYLRGSLAMGGFDPATSDLDFLVVTERPISEADYSALTALYDRLAKLSNKYGNDMEGAYIHRAGMRRFQPGERYPGIARGESFGWMEHRDNWVLERWTVSEHGITLFGPDPKTLIDPISSGELRAAVRTRLKDWAEWADDPNDPGWLSHRGHLAYVVETMCRALYTLATGELPTKPRAVAWALETLPEPWRTAVERSQAWRGDNTLDLSIVPEVRRFVLWAAAHRGGAEDIP